MSPVEVCLQVADVKRSAEVYRRIGFTEVGDEVRPGVRRLRHGATVLRLSDSGVRARPGQAGVKPVAREPRSAGFTLAVGVADFDDVLRYWEEEGMLIVSAAAGTGSRRAFVGLDPDGYELRLEEPTED